MFSPAALSSRSAKGNQMPSVLICHGQNQNRKTREPYKQIKNSDTHTHAPIRLHTEILSHTYVYMCNLKDYIAKYEF